MSSTGSFGRHVLAELKEATFEALDNLDLIKSACVKGAEHCGATVVNVATNKFEPQGCSVTVTLLESHIAIHTFPELNYASFDAYTCGQKADPMVILEYVLARLGGIADYELKYRGLPEGMKTIEKSTMRIPFSMD